MRHKILIRHDIHIDTPIGRIGWAYHRRSSALQKYAPHDMQIDICQSSEIPWGKVNQYDLLLNLEYADPNPSKFRNKGFKGVWVVSYNSDSNRRQRYWPPVLQHADFVIANNYDAWNFFGKLKKTCCISNGVDTEEFLPKTPIEDRPHKCIFAGSTGPTKMKGWPEVFRPLEERLPVLGFETDFRPVDDINPSVVMPTKGTIDWYNSASYCLIASQSEGTPNLATEAVACGCVLVSVPVGNVREWGTHGENCVLSNRDADSFVEALKFARDNREGISRAGMDTIRSGWSYGAPGERAEYFYQLFRRLIDDGPDSVRPFSYDEKHWSEI